MRFHHMAIFVSDLSGVFAMMKMGGDQGRESGILAQARIRF